MLGKWNTTPVNLELKYGTKPVCSQTYPVPRVQKGMPKKEFKILVRLGVPEELNEYKWGAPFFA